MEHTNVRPSHETITKDFSWLGEILDVQSIDGYTIVKYVNDSDEVLYGGYYPSLNNKTNEYFPCNSHHSYESFDRALLSLVAYKYDSDRLTTALFRVVGI